MQKLLTIVVPVYKVEPYINKCLDSCVLDDENLMAQLEVIIVNDGTPDNSAEMSREYVKRYPDTFRQIDKENGGHGSAWNVGLKEATGKYLRFLDSDDWLTNLDKLMEKLQETDTDLVFTHMNRYYADQDLYEEDRIIDEYGRVKSLNSFDFVNNGRPNIMDFWYVTYKRDILQFNVDKLFAEKTMYDDALLFVLPAIKSKTYVCFDFIVYNYFIGRAEQSATQEKLPKNIVARYKQCIYSDTFWNEHKSEDISENVVLGIQKAISNNAWLIFSDAFRLPYKLFKTIEHSMRHIFMYRELSAKNYKRYKKLPLICFYIIEKCRYWLRKY